MKTVLIVDDEPDVLMILSRRLTAAGFRVLEASNGAEGVKMAIKHLPDLIVMDVLMPGLSGGEAVKQIRSNNVTVNVPIIFLSAVMNTPAGDGSAGHQVNVGGQLYPAFPKLIDFKALITEITRRLR
jgi:CheY-like chemotaxis protein